MNVLNKFVEYEHYFIMFFCRLVQKWLRPSFHSKYDKRTELAKRIRELVVHNRTEKKGFDTSKLATVC